MVMSQEYSPSNSNSSPDTHSGLYDDDDAGGDLFETFEEARPKKSNGRKGNTPGAADKRATHNAIERARRGSLNGRFMTLAEALPAMANVKRPSKSAIVNKALDFVYESQIKEHALIKENNDLRRQVDQLRARLGMPLLPPPAPLLPKASDATKLPSPAPSAHQDESAKDRLSASPTGSFILPQNSSPANSDLAPSPAIPAPPYAILPVPSQAPNLNAFGAISSAAPQALTPYQLGAFANQPVDTSLLSSQQQSMLLAAHIQQQQQQHHFDMQQHFAAVAGGVGMNNMAWPGMGHGGFMHQAPMPVLGNGYSGLDGYTSFLA